jgi:hypothetical protein
MAFSHTHFEVLTTSRVRGGAMWIGLKFFMIDGEPTPDCREW